MRVLHAAAELFPWVKTGGLGDVIAALPPALAARGVDTRLVLPGFTALLDALPLSEVARVRTPFAIERVRIALAELPESGVRAYLIDHPAFYDRPGSPYADPEGREWPDNHRRFALLGLAAAALARIRALKSSTPPAIPMPPNSQTPPFTPTHIPAAMTRGPGIKPRLIESRIWSKRCVRAPRSTIVVNPARRSASAFAVGCPPITR